VHGEGDTGCYLGDDLARLLRGGEYVFIGAPDFEGSKKAEKILRLLLISWGIAFSAFSILTEIDPVGFSRFVGALILLVFATGSFSVAAAALTLSPRVGLAICGLMLLSLVFDAERSMVREIPSGTGQAGMFEDLVRDWILSRPDLDAYRKAKRPYPVIVTSAEGGGIVAAAHSFLVLFSTTDTLPELYPTHLCQHWRIGWKLG
jgi:hypothetical protein